MSAPPKPWVEGTRFVKTVVSRRRIAEQREVVTLECGHLYTVPHTTATAYRCRYCIREEVTGYNPPDDPTPARQSQTTVESL